MVVPVLRPCVCILPSPVVARYCCDSVSVSFSVLFFYPGVVFSFFGYVICFYDRTGSCFIFLLFLWESLLLLFVCFVVTIRPTGLFLFCFGRLAGSRGASEPWLASRECAAAPRGEKPIVLTNR